MPASEKTLADAFYETLKDVYFAEKKSVKACKTSAKAAKAPELKQAFEHHGEESMHHLERLTQVFEIIGKPAKAKTCDAILGITDEMAEDLEDFRDTPAADAVIIGCGQAIEHYEMARYGALIAWGNALGNNEGVLLLQQNLDEEKKTDALLTKMSRTVNAEAATVEG